MANRKKHEVSSDFNISPEMGDVEKTVVAQDNSDVTVVTKSKAEVRPCRIANIIGRKLHLYFDNYGIQIEVPKSKNYSIGDTIKIGYSGVIGQPDFKKWIVD